MYYIPVLVESRQEYNPGQDKLYISREYLTWPRIILSSLGGENLLLAYIFILFFFCSQVNMYELGFWDINFVIY